MLFRRFFARRQRERAAAELYLAAVNQARQPVFYARLGVPDSLEGRYDMIILHVWAVLRRLGRDGSESGHALGQAMVERMFADMDRNLREMGVTDLRVGKRVLNMAEAFYGRAGAYDKALAEGETELRAALARNLFQTVDPTPEHLAALATYVHHQLAHLDKQGSADLLEGKVDFHAPETAE